LPFVEHVSTDSKLLGGSSKIQAKHAQPVRVILVLRSPVFVQRQMLDLLLWSFRRSLFSQLKHLEMLALGQPVRIPVDNSQHVQLLKK
jgi:hypothetical protein